MPSRAPLFAVGLVSAVFAAGCGATVRTAGHVAADGRVFVEAPKYPGQRQGSGVSLVAEPELRVQSRNAEHTLKVRPFYRLDPDDDARSHADVRQASYQVALEHFEAGLGAGQFTWGALESFRPTDVMNQTDFVESIDYSQKLGQPYAEVGWIGEKVSLKVYYLPYFRARTFQGIRGRLRFPVPVDTSSPIFESKYKEWHPSGAARVGFHVGDLEAGISAISGLSRDPRFVAELTTGAVAPAYDVMHQASADVQWTLGAFVLKAEGFVRAWSTALRVFGGGGAGADYTIFKLAHDADFSVAVEFVFDTRPLDAAPTFFKHDAFGGLRLALNDDGSTEALGGAIVDVTDGTTFARAGVSHRLLEHWRVAVDGFVFLGPKGTLASSFLRDDHVDLRIAYYF